MNRGSAGAPSQPRSSESAGNFHVFGGNRSGGSGSVRSFSGEGRNVWENAPGAHNVISRSQSLSTIHNSFNAPPAAGSTFRSNSTLPAGSRFNRGSSLLANQANLRITSNTRIFNSGFGVNNGFNRFGFNRFGFNRFGFSRFGFGFGGCWTWNCGFGFGFGWGGWPWLGYWGWDPFWYDPWWSWPTPAYGYYGYPGYVYPDNGYSTPDDYSAPPDQQDNQYNYDNYNQNYPPQPNGNWVTPNGPSPAYSQNSAGVTVPILIYMKNGAVYTVRDYWMVDGELHYLSMNGAERTVDLDFVDLPRTNTENSKSGVRFIFKSEPSPAPPPPEGSAPPAAQPGDSNGTSPTPVPAQQINGAQQPDART